MRKATISRLLALLTSRLGAFFGFQATLKNGGLKFSANDEENDNKKPRTPNDIVIQDPICCIAFKNHRAKIKAVCLSSVKKM